MELKISDICYRDILIHIENIEEEEEYRDFLYMLMDEMSYDKEDEKAIISALRKIDEKKGKKINKLYEKIGQIIVEQMRLG